VGKLGVDDLEDMSLARLSGEGVEELLDAATECTLVFSGPDGWPHGVIVSFVRADGRFWLTAVSDRQHTRGIAADPRVTLVVSSAGTGLDGRRMVAIKARAQVHPRPSDQGGGAPTHRRAPRTERPEHMIRLLDTPKRVVIEVRPTAVSVSHDSRTIAGDGRGSAGASAP